MAWSLAENQNTLAVFADNRHGWRVRSRLDRPELGLEFAAPGADFTDHPRLRVTPPRDRVEPGLFDQLSTSAFPAMTENYFRGHDAIAMMPQDATSSFGLVVTQRVSFCEANFCALETIIAVQTSLLDSLPTIDLISDFGGQPLTLVPAAGEADPLSEHAVLPSTRNNSSLTQIPAVIELNATPSHSAAGSTVLMLPPSDRAAASELEPSATHLHIRLLAEFLEKGVIRKARFWTVRWAEQPAESAVAQLYQRLLCEPLPLTP
ncbi:hypothetical protein SH139x_004302 [Planctomycetaceae bacterium SH139]